MKTTKIGIIGCGCISDAYFSASKLFPVLEVVACADILPERARAKHDKWGVDNLSNEELLKRNDIEIVVNLTPPLVHSKIAMDTLGAGKHAYSEKPIGVDLEDAKKIIRYAREHHLRVGCAPDTFLGGGQQTARKLVDDGWIGKVLAGLAVMNKRQPEKSSIAPFVYDRGAGPMLDMGPYYITTLVNMLGAAKSVTAITSKGFDFHTFGPIVAEQYQEQYKPFDPYPVNVNTHQTGVIEFQSGALITVIMSFDVAFPHHYCIELYGTEGSLLVPDPNTFGGPINIYRNEYPEEQWHSQSLAFGNTVNSRSIGVADLAMALRSGRPHRANGDLAYHVLEILQAFDRASQEGGKILLESTCSRPEPLPPGLEGGTLPE